jgi:cyclopropane fatty-acyl-phospholipid synthase-like methyltransferase
MTTQEEARTPGDINPQYATLTDVSVEILGGNMHVGYWTDDNDDAPMEVATNRLTDLVIDKLEVRPGQRLLDVGCGNGAPAVRVVRAKQVEVASGAGGALVAGASALNDALLTLNERNASFIACRPAPPSP